MTRTEAQKLMNGDRVRWTDGNEEVMGTVSGTDETDLVIIWDDNAHSYHPLWPGNDDKLRYLELVTSHAVATK